MLLPGRHGEDRDAVNDYRYSFQGQEHDDEVKGKGNSINYKYRMHDPRVGRFFAVDPLAPKYPHNSPYAFSENRVIDGLELEGLEVRLFNSLTGELTQSAPLNGLQTKIATLSPFVTAVYNSNRNEQRLIMSIPVSNATPSSAPESASTENAGGGIKMEFVGEGRSLPRFVQQEGDGKVAGLLKGVANGILDIGESGDMTRYSFENSSNEELLVGAGLGIIDAISGARLTCEIASFQQRQGDDYGAAYTLGNRLPSFAMEATSMAFSYGMGSSVRASSILHHVDDITNVPYYRVQGPTNFPRIFLDDFGNVTFRQKGSISLSKGNLEHALYFQKLKGADSKIYQFEVPRWFDNMVDEFAIPQRNSKGNLAPKIVDPNQPGTSLEFPSYWNKWFQENVIPGSGKILE